MKTKIYILSLAIVAILFSSCGSLSISQKRYSRGLNISLFRSKDEKPIEKKATIAHKNSGKKVEENSTVSTKPVVEETKVVATENDFSSNSDINITTNSESKNEVKSQPKLASTKSKKREINNIINKLQAKSNTNTTNDSDVALILLIIIAIFVPPLAVYLYYGEINTQFWFSLILTILAGGLFFVGRAIGWGFPVIHALLVLLGVFD